jgi:hypothetical protein
MTTKLCKLTASLPAGVSHGPELSCIRHMSSMLKLAFAQYDVEICMHGDCVLDTRFMEWTRMKIYTASARSISRALLLDKSW